MVKLLLEHGPALLQQNQSHSMRRGRLGPTWRRLAVAVVAHLDVEDSDEVGPLGVVLDQAGHPTAPLHPVRAAVSSIHLDHSRAQRLGAEVMVRRGHTKHQPFFSNSGNLLHFLSWKSQALTFLFDSIHDLIRDRNKLWRSRLKSTLKITIQFYS